MRECVHWRKLMQTVCCGNAEEDVRKIPAELRKPRQMSQLKRDLPGASARISVAPIFSLSFLFPNAIILLLQRPRRVAVYNVRRP
jgi:hypothetical protein